MDCMEYMAGLPDKAFDLAIVDPPYNVGASDGKFGGKKGAAANVTVANGKHYANHDKTPEKEYFDELFRVSKNQIIWGANYYPEYLYHSGWIVWDKLKPAQNPLSDCELAFQSINKLVTKYISQWSGFAKGNKEERETARIHPNQKPVSLYRWTLQQYAKPGDKILDTHGGSGSICIACHDLCYDLTWMELDEDYYKAACERYQNHAAQCNLFVQKTIEKTEQGTLF